MITQLFKNIIATIIVVFSATGLFASFILTIEKIEITKNPRPLSCDLNSVISCSTVMKSDQADLLGFPNSIIGIIGYAMTLSFGLSLLFAEKHSKLLTIAFNIGAFGAFVFSYWLIYESVFKIGALCPFCLLSAASATNIFFALTIYNLRETKNSFIKKALDKQYYFYLFGLWYLVIILGIVWKYLGMMD